MSAKTRKPKKLPQLKLAEELSLAAAMPLKDALLVHIKSNEMVIVDGSCVKRITTPCVQVLLAAEKMISSEGRQFVLKNSSDAITSSFADLGLESELKNWSMN